MKKFFSLLMLGLFLCNFAISQSDEFVLTWPIVANEARKSDNEIVNAKKAANIRTWTERGRKYLEVFTFDLKSAYPGMPITDALLNMKGAPKNEQKIGEYTVYSYDRIDLYFADGKLVKYERTGDALSFYGDKTPLDVAADAYIKAKELDKDGKRSILISEQLKKIIDLYTSEGYYHYMTNNFGQASFYFNKIGNLLLLKYDSYADSTKYSLLNDCGTINKLAKEYEKAIKFYRAALEYNTNAPITVYGDIMVCQKEKGDTIAAVQTLLTIIEKFPSDPNIVSYTTELINFYIMLNQYDKALAYLSKAIEAEPNNVNFLFNIAYLYDTEGKTDLAIQYYKKAIEISPKDEGSNLNLGVLYRNQAKTKLDEADAAYGTKNYKPLFEKGKELLRLAFPYLEVYAEVVEDSKLKKDAYRDLASIYAQLGMTDKYNIARKKMDAIK